ncbi:hypothetical protein [Sphingomonas xinjiangensis]|uniref:Uncharacterized protein n=1 Tax=Sphingomonas xinjiangensis TaxID=643568 RepID=A0A840YT85_9SPHN|nr:hypothetical protein [Sphingomonas xinjiangensis]MBB5712880.1 hypothetical protein [Sphingomonas xinjiangensis]
MDRTAGVKLAYQLLEALAALLDRQGPHVRTVVMHRVEDDEDEALGRRAIAERRPDEPQCPQ